MKFSNACLLIILSLILFSYNANAQTGYYGTYFTQTAADSNVAADGSTLLNNASLNGDSSKICIFTSLFGTSTPYGFNNPVNFGLQYYSPQWDIYQENGDSVPFGSEFNVLVPSMNGVAFMHIADSTNIDSNYTILNDSAINNNPNALLFISHSYNPYNDTTGTTCDHTLGVSYNSSTGQWVIYNDDSVAPFIPNTQFNVFAVNPGPNAFLQIADTTNTLYFVTYINNPYLNGNPNAAIFATYNLGAAGYYAFNQSQIAVWYDDYENQWAIYNVQNYDSIYAGSAFNVLIADVVPTGVANLADDYNLSLYPNPASSFSYLKYELKEAADVKIDLMNSEGQEVAHIFNGQQNEGIHSMQFPLSSLAAGLYFCKFSADGNVGVKAVVKQ